MNNVFTVIGTSWDFYKSQSVLRAVLFWLLMIPLTLLLATGDIFVEETLSRDYTMAGILEGSQSAMPLIGFLFIQVALGIVMLWGIACVLLVGKRLMQTRAGRTRTSFSIVRKEAGHFVGNLFLTDILRTCFTFFWSLLLIVPGIIYFVRTFFYAIAIVCEGKGYREALRHSKDVVQGHTTVALLHLAGTAGAIFLPLAVIDGFVIELVLRTLPDLVRLTYLTSAYLYSLGIVIFMLSTVSLYSQLKKLPS
ncbi:hypothetical protein COU78_00090 [Candidatus Peregrinibacteria bacterium CG10_big_fil_rev_8_21_14_0_10_49_24]|nr:MAG: hypothetical protein COV83_06135 [Candidatus Peregrinibacteria bacterium CG11_big_fil_rev_8_21_14_0_20_49_14]PIR51588.1 MAG: hypothetical protein COU78_00090 [Candidatus Peregrinibacteria bacterium CG10_big_fil_rev_8_21_14_0_10_49_24]PJA68050.1 MAG: hypothetical protein CO157_01875 [Candidatus Peregrinibacteria bacterium CG_4_9_14_3_um_filter_49_12]